MKTYSSIPALYEKSDLIFCPCCNSTQFRFKFWDLDQFIFAKCKDCGLIMQNPQPIFEDIEQRYDSTYCNYEIENSLNFLELMLLGLKDVDLFDRIDKSQKGFNRFLDIGCATGALVEYFSKKGFNSIGVELCKESAKWGRKNRGIEIKDKTLEECKFEDNSFDIVHASHLIEHLNNPENFIKEIYRILVSEGLFACITPNSSSLQRFLFGKEWRSVIADHLFLFSYSQLTRLLKSNGFEIIDSGTWGGLAKNSVPQGLKSVVDKMIKKTLWGDVMIILAKKSSSQIG